jgi:hypothetical protein
MKEKSMSIYTLAVGSWYISEWCPKIISGMRSVRKSEAYRFSTITSIWDISARIDQTR